MPQPLKETNPTAIKNINTRFFNNIFLSPLFASSCSLCFVFREGIKAKERPKIKNQKTIAKSY
jgi:hypothetical protein